MTRASRDALLGASDLREEEIDLPTIGLTVLVRSLPAAYSNEAQYEALEMTTTEHRGRQVNSAKINSVRLEELQVLHGLIDPKLNSIEDVRTFSQRCGSAWHKVVGKIQELSGLDQETVEKTETTFPVGGTSEGRAAVANGNAAGGDGPDLPRPTGVAAGDPDR